MNGVLMRVLLFVFAVACQNAGPKPVTPSERDRVYREPLRSADQQPRNAGQSSSSSRTENKEKKLDRVSSTSTDDTFGSSEEDQGDAFGSSEKSDENDSTDSIKTDNVSDVYLVTNEVVKSDMDCSQDLLSLESDVYLDGSNDFDFGSWNNTGADPTSDPVAVYNDDAYKPDMGRMKETDCDDREVLTTTFVKKLHNWHSQHFNGLVMTGGNVETVDIEGVVVELKGHSTGSSIPSADTLTDRFGAIYQAQSGQNLDVEDIDQSQHNYLLTFEHAESGKVLKARYLFQIEERDLDKWIRFVVPAEELEWFYEENYMATPLTYEAAINEGLSFTRATFVAESSSLGTLRSLLGLGDDGAFNALNVPAIFKEQKVSLHRMSVIQKK